MTSKPSDVTKQLKLEASTEFASVMNAFYKELKKNTPVKTGRARNSWAKYKDTRIGQGQTQTVITNTVPYIGPLDQGSSKQAPNGIVDPSWSAANKK